MTNLIEVGQIWEVTTEDFLTSGREEKTKRQTKLKLGEKIEIRYPYSWHFRTEDNIYFHAEEATILQNCRHFGTIIEHVRFQNKANLEEILRLRLYKSKED